MLKIEPHKIVVGISPTQSSDAVVEYAGVEAARRGCGVHLVAVEHPVWDTTATVDVATINGEMRRVDAAMLARYEDRLRQWLPDSAAISTEITHGRVAAALRSIAVNAELVALQHHRMGRPFHLPSLSVTNAVAANASVPVVAVPDDWHEAEAEHDVVVAAVKGHQGSEGVAQAAFGAAVPTRSELVLMHVWSWSDDEHEQDVDVLISPRSSRSKLLTDRLRHELVPLMARYPEVSARVKVLYGQPEYVLMTQSAKARLVVMGRHHPGLPLGSHLGPVTRTVLTYARCPVMVVDPTPEETVTEAPDSAETARAVGG